jgi:hypothetical protein
MGSGYSDSRTGVGRWKVNFFYAGMDHSGIARTSALYRAALLAKASNQSYMQIVDARAKIGVHVYLGEMNSDVNLVVVGVPSMESPSLCEAKKDIWKSYCGSFDVEQTIRAAAQKLDRTPDQMARDYADAQAKVAAYPPLKGG